MAAGARQTIDALREQLARLEAVVDTQVTRLEVGLGNAVEANSTLSTQLVEAILMLDSQRDRMETLEKTFEERMEVRGHQSRGAPIVSTSSGSSSPLFNQIIIAVNSHSLTKSSFNQSPLFKYTHF